MKVKSKPESLRATYELIDYDLWGNEKDGYTVNQAFRTGKTVSLLRSNLETDVKLIKALKLAGIIKKRIHAKSVTVDGESDSILYFGHRGVPAFELRKVK